MQIKKSPQEGRELPAGERVSEMHKNEISLGLRTTTSRFYRTDVSQFSYTSKM